MVYVVEGKGLNNLYLREAPRNWLTKRSIRHCWTIWYGWTTPQTLLEGLIWLAGKLDVKFFYFLVDPVPDGAIPMDLEDLKLFILEKGLAG